MDERETGELLAGRGVIRRGHFLRLSGRHTDWYVQCARLFEDADTAGLIGAELAARAAPWGADVVLCAAVGGVLPGYETARAMGLRMVFCEKRDGALILRRGFELPPGARVLLVEDEVSTGQSVREMCEIVHALGGTVAGIVCVVDKSGGGLPFPAPFSALYTLSAAHYRPAACPLCQEGAPLENAG
ncbi:MAG TPA: orotate phosphoribosyltransferase [Candidatus Limnocylindria bacterium]|nr:orotate phosphoribosyltransferase [Candidatus Limnocylindria bacterium]